MKDVENKKITEMDIEELLLCEKACDKVMAFIMNRDEKYRDEKMFITAGKLRNGIYELLCDKINKIVDNE